MNKAELAFLEKVYDREVSAALSGGIHLFQSRGQVAAKLATDGYLQYRMLEVGRNRFGPLAVSGYELTDAGRLAYSMACADEQDESAEGAGKE